MLTDGRFKLSSGYKFLPQSDSTGILSLQTGGHGISVRHRDPMPGNKATVRNSDPKTKSHRASVSPVAPFEFSYPKLGVFENLLTTAC